MITIYTMKLSFGHNKGFGNDGSDVRLCCTLPGDHRPSRLGRFGNTDTLNDDYLTQTRVPTRSGVGDERRDAIVVECRFLCSPDCSAPFAAQPGLARDTCA